jgi:predicted anti-sigma-YlaC factor YlaD
MSVENHERAQMLLRAARIEGVTEADRTWLDEHLGACESCAHEATRLAASIASLKALNVTAPSDLVRRTALAIERRTEQRRLEHEPTIFLWLAAGVATLWAILTTPYVWAAFEWVGRLVHVRDLVWELAFFMWWFLPATFLAAAAGWRTARSQS